MKKVIIIGASSGIGKQLALLYLKAGHKVGITGRRKELLEEIQQQYPSQTEMDKNGFHENRTMNRAWQQNIHNDLQLAP